MEQDALTNESSGDSQYTDELKAIQDTENFQPPAVNTSDELQPITEERDWQVGCNLNYCLLNVHVNNRWTDMTIRCGDASVNRPLHAHKIILASRSPVFEAMFCHESKTEFDFPDADVNIFDKMLRFMYTDDADLELVDEAISLLQMAHMYRIPVLVDHCALFLQDNLTTDNVCKTLDCALKYDVAMLRDFCCDYIDKNAKAVIKTHGFLHVSKDGLAYMLKGDTFYAPEDIIYQIIERWAKIKLSELGKEETGQNIRDVLGDAFYHLRLPTLPPVAMMKCIKNKGYFSVKEYEDIFECNLGCLPKLDFMSNVRRVPIEQMFVVSPYRQNQNCSRTVQQTLKITVEKAVRLKYIEIPLFKMFIKYGSSRWSTIPNEEEILPTDIGLGLSVVVNIDRIGLKKKFNVRQISENSSTIQFSEPVLLKKRSSPLDLNIKIEPNCPDDRVMMIGTTTTKVLSYLSKDEESHHISISHAKSFIIIKAIGIENCSFRENEEGPEESESGHSNSDLMLAIQELCRGKTLNPDISC